MEEDKAQKALDAMTVECPECGARIGRNRAEIKHCGFIFDKIHNTWELEESQTKEVDQEEKDEVDELCDEIFREDDDDDE